MKKKELKGKYLVAFDTICDGHQVGTDEDGQPCPELFDSHDEAFKSLFEEAICGIEGNEEHLEDEEARSQMIFDMKDLVARGNVGRMIEYFDKNPDANYYDEFVQKADEFILGRKAIYTGQGLVIEGTKLEDL